MKEQRAKRDVNPSRRVRHMMVERWDPILDLDDTAYHCVSVYDYYNETYCGQCELCTGKPAKFVESGDEELTFDYC